MIDVDLTIPVSNSKRITPKLHQSHALVILSTEDNSAKTCRRLTTKI